jgi:magnesium chelatase subunit D
LGTRGRLVATRPHEPGDPVALAATARATGLRRAHDADAPVDLHGAVRTERVGNLAVIAVDASGSMGVERRMEAAKGAVLGLLLDAYQRRDRVALVTFRGDGAEVVLRPTSAVEVARARLGDVPCGGRTPLAAGVDAALDLALAASAASDRIPLLVIVTDGRATAAPDGVDPLDAALEAARRVRRRRVTAVVVDAEDDGPGAAPRLGLAATLAEAMGASCLPLSHLSAATIKAMVP